VAWSRITTLGADPKVEGLGSQLKSVSDELKSQLKLRTNLDGLFLLSLDQDIDLSGVAALPRSRGVEGQFRPVLRMV
jgi:hypothetical protein